MLVTGARLESVWSAKARGFNSLSLRASHGTVAVGKAARLLLEWSARARGFDPRSFRLTARRAYCTMGEDVVLVRELHRGQTEVGECREAANSPMPP